MPYTLRKLPNQNKWKVFNSKTKRLHARATSHAKALRQIRLLNAIDHGFVPR
jgi:hypothetical protein